MSDFLKIAVPEITLQELTAGVDVNGNEIEVGTVVRSFDFPMYSDGNVLGMDLTGERASYVEGVVKAIGEDELEGCKRYRIEVTRAVRGGMEADLSSRADGIPAIFPPLNGTPSLFCGPVTFGVVKIV